jgi:hypothetical protein
MIAKKLLDKIHCYYCGKLITQPHPRWQKHPCCSRCWDKLDRELGNPYAEER